MPTIIPLTAEAVWLPHLRSLPAWEPPMRPTLVLAPHPDDETLGAGGLIAKLRAQDVPVTVVAITDGEKAYADTPHGDRVRVPEQETALARLGVLPARIHRLRLPDANVTAHEEELVDALSDLLAPGMHLIAPWPQDFHPDHEAAGRAAERVAHRFGLDLSFYLFWTWHRGRPELLQNLPMVKLPLSEGERARKLHALDAHASQLEHPDGQPILSPELLLPSQRPFEIYLPS